MRHPKFEAVRQRYRRTCGYCGVTEAAAGSELTIDHSVVCFLDAPHPILYYGRTKLEAERRLARHDLNYCSLRCALMYGWNLRPMGDRGTRRQGDKETFGLQACELVEMSRYLLVQSSNSL